MSRWRYLYKSPSFYWHTGYQHIAVISTLLSGVCIGGVLPLLYAPLTGMDWRIVLLLLTLTTLLDVMGLVVLVAYVVLRPQVPTELWFIDIKSRLDALAVWLLCPIVASVVLNRLMTFATAAVCGYPFGVNTPRR